MHLPIKMVRQSAIVVQPTQIRTTDIAHLQLLVPARPAGITERLELPLLVSLLLHRSSDPEELLVGPADLALLPQDLDLHQAALHALTQVADCLEQRIRLADLVGSLLQSALRDVNPAVALVDVLLQVTHVVILEAPFLLLRERRGLVF